MTSIEENMSDKMMCLESNFLFTLCSLSGVVSLLVAAGNMYVANNAQELLMELMKLYQVAFGLSEGEAEKRILNFAKEHSDTLVDLDKSK